MVVVKFAGTLGLDLGQSGFELDLAGGTLADVIDQLIVRCGVKVREELLDEEGNLDYAYGIFSDGEKVDDLATQIQDGAELLVIDMIGGG